MIQDNAVVNAYACLIPCEVGCYIGDAWGVCLWYQGFWRCLLQDKQTLPRFLIIDIYKTTS